MLPTASGVTRKLAPVEFSGTITLAGSEITAGSKPLNETGEPPGPAGADKVIVIVPGELNRFKGFGLRVTPIPLAVIVTVVGLLLVKPSLTISCTTYGPCTSAKKLGVLLLAALEHGRARGRAARKRPGIRERVVIRIE